MNVVYVLLSRGFEFDDLDYGSFSIEYISLDKSKIEEKFQKERNFF